MAVFVAALLCLYVCVAHQASYMSATLAHRCWGVIVGPSLLRVLFVMATQRTGDSSEAMNVPAKHRKLVTCRTVSFSALECFCQLAKERPEVLEFNRQGQYRASQDLWSCMGASSLLGPHEWRHASFRGAFKEVAATPPWQRQLAALWQRAPCRQDAPWELILYADELTPGNVLRVDNHQKCMAFYVSLMGFPPDACCHTSFWIPVGVFRSSKAKLVPASFSAIARRLLRHMFLIDKIHLGFIFEVNGTEVRLFFKLGCTLFDGDAYRAIW